MKITVNKIIRIIIIFIILIVSLSACTYRHYDFEYVKIEFNNGDKKVFTNCSGSIVKNIWVIIKDGNTYSYPLSSIKSFDWKYTAEDLIKQSKEIKLG